MRNVDVDPGYAALHREAEEALALGSPQVKLSVIMPVHNEQDTIATAIAQVLNLDSPFSFNLELIVVDDGSSDWTSQILASTVDDRLKVHRHPRNLGKGAAVLTGIAMATGSHALIFDADLEYSAQDIPRVLAPIMRGEATVVYGTRMFGMNTVYQSFRHGLGNRLTTLAANLLYDSCISDLHTCIKLIPVSLLRDMTLVERGFGLDSEITGELLRRGHRPFEVPVTYISRSRAQGKQLTWTAGVRSLVVLGRVRLRRQRPKSPSYPVSAADNCYNEKLVRLRSRDETSSVATRVAERHVSGRVLDAVEEQLFSGS